MARKLRMYEAAWKQLKVDKHVTINVRTGYERRIIKAVCKEKDMDKLRPVGTIIVTTHSVHKSKVDTTVVKLVLKRRTLLQDLQ